MGAVAQGVNVHRVPAGRYAQALMIGNAKHDDQAATGSFTTAGTPLVDTAAHLSISVVRSDAAGADGHIQFGAEGTTSPAGRPAAAAQPDAPTAAAPPSPDSPDGPDDDTVIGSTSTPGSTPATAPTDRGSLAVTGATGLWAGGMDALLTVGGGAAVLLLRRPSHPARTPQAVVPHQGSPDEAPAPGRGLVRCSGRCSRVPATAATARAVQRVEPVGSVAVDRSGRWQTGPVGRNGPSDEENSTGRHVTSMPAPANTVS
ncbi:hypothetical protein OG689_03560 [Kitasatospora sp. NBC_00240]|uniref:hypothetical protein n=1 Tax=Kitasatospora sp. NBC_00240 TaxID=2903567 RepID=UPI0022561BB6|nr:hypothetical protein [Kitasatospora sp. NBC_00240]MCX5208384.1 hypothetical protein [Kitasatospora sp. NBC_00240]